MNFSRVFGIVLCIALAFFIANCTSGSGHGSPAHTTPQDAQTGRFLDSAVTGVEYSSRHWSHITGFDGILPSDVPGSFMYQPGEEVTFSIGGVVLGSARAKRNVTPIDLVPGAVDTRNDTVVHMCQFLQSLDEDLVPENGIVVTEDVRDVLAGYEAVSFESLSEEDVENIFVTLNEAKAFPENKLYNEDRTLVPADDALIHFEETLIVIEQEEAQLDPFTAGITKPVSDVISFQGQSFPISGNASGGTGSYFIEWVLLRRAHDSGYEEIYRGSNPPGNVSSLSPGIYLLQYEATDYEYGKTIRDKRIINVYNSSLNSFPTYPIALSLARISPESTVVSQGQSVSLSAKIIEGNPPFFYSWSYPDTATCTQTDNPLNPLFIFSTQGLYRVRVMVRDSLVPRDVSYDENNCDFTVIVQ